MISAAEVGPSWEPKLGSRRTHSLPPYSPPQSLCQGQPEHSHLPGEVPHLKNANPGTLVWDREGKFTLSGKPSLLHRLAGTSQRPFVYLSCVLPPGQVRWGSGVPGTKEGSPGHPRSWDGPETECQPHFSVRMLTWAPGTPPPPPCFLCGG